MKQLLSEDIKKALRHVPEGRIQVSCHGSPDTADSPSGGEFRTLSEGRGLIDVYQVLPGIRLAYHLFLASQVRVHHGSGPDVLEINYCRSGRAGWNMGCGASVYLGPGDMSVHSMGCCSDSVVAFPFGYCEGICVSVDLKELSRHLPAVLQEAGADPSRLYDTFCSCHTSHGLAAREETACIFQPLYGLEERFRLSYMKLKVQELLLYLYRVDPGTAGITQYQSRQTEIIRQIHHQLTGSLDRRYTIEELSRQYLINASSLKEVFKAVYGLPIATYMKEYRIRRSMELLQQTDRSIADIAALVGYESPGKFTNAFKDCTRMTPSRFRKEARSGPPDGSGLL